MVLSLDNGINFFHIIAAVLQRDSLALYMVIICLDFVLWNW